MFYILHSYGGRLLATLLAVAVTGPAMPAGAATDPPAVVAYDGRALETGSLVARGVQHGEHCVFGADDAVTVLADDATDSAVRLSVESGCRLVVAALGAPAVPGNGAGVRYTAAKLHDPTSGVAGSAALPRDYADSAVDMAVGEQTSAASVAALAADIATATQAVDVQAVQVIWNEAGVQEYRDWISVKYVRNTKTKKVGALEPYDGACEGSYIDENVLYGPYANDIMDCSYKEVANGPSKVGFVTGGTYRKMFATITLDERTLTETFEATYSGTTRRVCSQGGALRIGWSFTCFFDVD